MWYSLPNCLSALRLGLLPGVLWSLQRCLPGWAAVLFGAAALTDLLDGALARRLKSRTSLGALLDPLADKLLLDCTFLALMARGGVPAWLAQLVVTRDVLLAVGLGAVWALRLRVRISPSPLGKAAVAAQFITLLCALGREAWGIPPLLPPVLVLTTGGLTIASALQYSCEALRLRREA